LLRVETDCANIDAIREKLMRIDLYTTCWNEERMIPFFLRHYEPLVDRIVVFDDGSTDRSRDLLGASKKVELRKLEHGESPHLEHIKEMNRCWKESRGRADWVMIADIDEHIFHPSLRDCLRQCQKDGVTVLDPVGYEMVSLDFSAPQAELSKTIRRGVRFHLLDKKAVFDPNAIEEINYTPGRHLAAPSGRVIFPAQREVRLLHYRHLGLEYVLLRSKEMKGRNTAFDLKMGWGSHYLRSDDEIKRDFDKILREAEDIL
jgi:glycosyltransferase involved in cell wall biosynthesis